jgi:hypothetical protein
MFPGASKFCVSAIFLLLSQVLLCAQIQAQDLEPRRWSHLPTGLNVLGLGGGWTDGDILFDPVLRIQDATFELSIASLGYVRTFEWLGKSSRVDVSVPYAAGRWEGLVDGEFTSVRRRGFMDPRLRFSMNLYGAPPLKGAEFVQYRREHPVDTTIGAAVQVQFPFGDYNDKKLINLGNNRFYVRPQIGVLHQHYKWQFELTGSVFLYQSNDEFFNGNELRQKGLWFTQSHAIYTFKPGLWASASLGYGYGGESSIDNVQKNDARRNLYWALSLGVPINANQGIKLVYFSSNTNTSLGSNSNALLAAWSLNWSK